VYALIRQAVLQKKIIVATYEGRVRKMCPHVLGTKDGKPRVMAYQFAGGSARGIGRDGSDDNWRCFEVDELSAVSVVDGKWHTAPNYCMRPDLIDEIDVRV
jgi:hypothetical protein